MTRKIDRLKAAIGSELDHPEWPLTSRDERIDRLTTAVVGALDGGRAPRLDQVRHARWEAQRNASIRRLLRADVPAEKLSRRWGLSARQIRRIGADGDATRRQRRP